MSMSFPQAFPEFAVISVCLAACTTDVRWRRIPNALTFPAAGAAILFHWWVAGSHAAAAALGGWFVGVLLFSPFFIAGGLGAGDLKLLGAVGAWLGPVPALFVA